MMIMTSNGWQRIGMRVPFMGKEVVKPAGDFSYFWKQKNDRVRDARETLEAARASLPLGIAVSDEERRNNHHTLLGLSVKYQKALDALLG